MRIRSKAGNRILTLNVLSCFLNTQFPSTITANFTNTSGTFWDIHSSVIANSGLWGCDTGSLDLRKLKMKVTLYFEMSETTSQSEVVVSHKIEIIETTDVTELLQHFRKVFTLPNLSLCFLFFKFSFYILVFLRILHKCGTSYAPED